MNLWITPNCKKVVAEFSNEYARIVSPAAGLIFPIQNADI
jgi:hypothetical protein